jgi:uncharacterized membrane protein YhaH (DUF805 family)
MKVGHVAIFDNARFDGNADFSHMHIGTNFEAAGAHFTHPQRTATFSNTQVESRFILWETSFAGWVRMSGMTASDFSFRNVTWPVPGRFLCEELTYDHISTTEVRNGVPVDRIMDWPRTAAFSSSLYTELAAFLDGRGATERAKAIRVEQQWREGETLDPLHWVWNRFLWVTVGYGQYAGRAFLWMALFVGIGFFVFRTGMEHTDPQAADPGYQPFWYSLGLFLPGVELGQKAWRPHRKRVWACHYAQVHVLMGWVLVPIALAALTGLLK